jgi:hypothetical protein
MTHTIKSAEDLRWFMTHTQGFRDGHVTDVHVSKRRIFDERSGQDVLAGSTATVVVRYSVQDRRRVARLLMQGVSDLCIFEQDGADCSLLGTIQVELSEGRFRFWFDPQGKLYVVCEEALLEEIILPQDETSSAALKQWTFRGESDETPSLEWLLDQLDQAGLPCAWKASRIGGGTCGLLCLEGQLVTANEDVTDHGGAVAVQVYRHVGQTGFTMRVRLVHREHRAETRLLNAVAQIVTRAFPGARLVEEAGLPHGQWADWK